MLNYRSPRDTIKCVEALTAQTIADQIEIVIVDNHSDDESIGWIRALLGNIPSVRIIEDRDNIGYGKGNNAGMRLSRGKYILIINPDNTLLPDALEQMLAIFSSHPDAGIVGPALVHPDGSIRPSARAFPQLHDLLRKRLFPQKWQAEYSKSIAAENNKECVEVDWLVGACLLMPRELMTSLGGFDERFFLFFEDIDLCRRVKLLGKKVLYVPGIKVLDRRNRLSGSSIFSLLTKKMTWIHVSSAIKYFWKWA